MKFFTTILFASLTLTASAAGPYYVDYASGSDANNGTASGTPWKHLPGDPSATGTAGAATGITGTIYLKGGVVYSLATTSGITFDGSHYNTAGPLTITSGSEVSWGSGTPALEGAGVAYWVIVAQPMTNMTLRGLEIRNTIGATSNFENAAVRFSECLSNVIDSCVIHDIGTNNSNCHADTIEIGYGNASPYYFSYHTITNCTIYNSTQKGIDIGGASGNFIMNNYIWNHRDHGVCFTSSSNIISGNTISNIGVTVWLAPGTDPGYGIKFSVGSPSACTNNWAVNNLITHCHRGGIVIDNSQNAGGWKGDDNKIFNNTIIDIDNTANTYAAGLNIKCSQGPVNGTLVFNNIFSCEAPVGSAGGLTTPVALYTPASGSSLGNNNIIAYNLFWNPNNAIYPGLEIGGTDHNPSWANFSDTGSTSPDYRFKVAANGTGNSFSFGTQFFDTDPKFTSYPGNVTLQAASPIITAGTNLSAYFTKDMSGATRSGWSIGAFEYGSTPTLNINTHVNNLRVTSINVGTVVKQQ